MTGSAIRAAIAARLKEAGIAGAWVGPEDTGTLGARKGAYVLMIRLDKPQPVGAGRTKAGHLPAGTYLYAGSAHGAGGLAARLRRHFRKDKAVHWHIDRLTLPAGDLAAFAVPGGNECQLVGQLLQVEGIEIALEGFGSSDCRTCSSHLLVVRS